MSGQITVSNRQRAVRVKLAELREFASRALEECKELAGSLRRTGEIGVVLISDQRIAELHKQFMHEPGPTDVITFQHGEIFVSAETARRQALEFGTTLDHELRLYIGHGLLHLHGYDDKSSAGAAKMRRLQEKLVDRALGRSKPNKSR